jgi:hypothetical protein
MSDLSFIGREFNIREENTDGSIIQLAIKNGRVVSVDQVENGLACGCRCPDCDGILIAKNRGEIKVHHFAHESGQICETSQETALHLLAKEVLIEQKAILLPSPHNGNVQRFDAAAAEVTQYLLDGGIFRPDVELIRDDKKLFVEFRVAHAVNDAKIRQIRLCGVDCVEIDLQDLPRVDAEGFPNRKGIEARLLEDKGKTWIYPHHEISRPKLQSKPLPSPLPARSLSSAYSSSSRQNAIEQTSREAKERQRKTIWSENIIRINADRQRDNLPQYIHERRISGRLGYFVDCPRANATIEADKCKSCSAYRGEEEISGAIQTNIIAYYCDQTVTLCARTIISDSPGET